MFLRRNFKQDRRRRKRQLLNTSVRVFTKSGCIEALGVNSDQVAPLSEHVKQAIAIPEFGLIPPIVVTLAMIASIVIYRKFF